MGNETFTLVLRCPRRNKSRQEAAMTDDRRPLPDDLNAIIGGRPADPQTMQRLIKCNLVEEFDGTALLTARGVEAAALLSPTK